MESQAVNSYMRTTRNTTVRTPGKVFVSLPRNREARESWQRAMGRSNVFLSDKSTKYCSEDHFNEDLDNYRYFKTMKNVPIKLKLGVVPHIFD
ncbi:hypothetical protein NQ318_010000 [Aromia moschata]|uniref:THAP-type domain-containing protein n=1 Tax=Aromia moschata TaxID=1265417 RepID=A0AAV8YA55_9CUCU|nr:hypothetical protein NQ318_010000 [Aromia moschata]